MSQIWSSVETRGWWMFFRSLQILRIWGSCSPLSLSSCCPGVSSMCLAFLTSSLTTAPVPVLNINTGFQGLPMAYMIISDSQLWLADWFNGSIWFKESFSDSHRPAITGEDEISMTGCISVWGRCWRTAPCPTRRGWRPWRTSWRRPDSWPRRLTGNTMRCRSRACVCWRFCDCSNWSSFEVLY